MISYSDAQQIIAELRLGLGTERLPLERCGGRILAEELTAKIPSPPYTNSAMDGFAVRLDDVRKGPLAIHGTVYARAVEPSDIPPQRAQSCVRIMTGAYLPEWAEAVIPVEQSELLPDGRVQFKEPPARGDNIRREGDDLQAGAPLMKAGAVLEPERIMVAAGFGHRELLVQKRPRLCMFSTGDELAEPGTELKPGALYNSSKYFLLAAAQALGLEVTAQPTVPDDEERAAELLRPALDSGEPTIVITTGAVSAGEADFVPRLGERLGFRALFHKVAIRPGKPVYLAQRGDVLWLGLPGNAISTCIGWHVFAKPLLHAVAGTPPARRERLILANEITKPEQLRCFFRAEVNGKKAWVARKQGSAQLAASIGNTAYVELPEGQTRIPADSRVEALIV
jgi:molybdopterin molybdotransferase